MKFETSDKSAIHVGNVSNNTISIDTENINFIVTILSTNLYSNPIESFIRETVSNAWDSHVEAKVDEPVVIELGKDTEDRYFCIIRDFGVGLSPDRFNKIYRNIGSSTKRGDNEQIGGFGIGRFSALAYSEVVYITTNFEGIKYKYMMYKDGNTIAIDLMYSGDTDEANGLEVMVYVKQGDLEYFTQAIKKQLIYFENLFVINNTKYYRIDSFENDFNNLKIKKFNNFFVSTLKTGEIDIILGKVRYPLRFNSLTKAYRSHVKSYPISLKFNVGDLEVTPNREEILYTKKNIDKIESVLEKAIKEIDEIITVNSTKDYDNFQEYIQRISNVGSVPIFETDSTSITIPIVETDRCNYTYKGVKYNMRMLLDIRRDMYSSSYINFHYSLKGRKLFYKSGKKSLNNLRDTYKDRVFICDVPNLKTLTKDFIRDTFPEGSIFIPTSTSLRKYYKIYAENALKDYSYLRFREKKEMKECFRLVFREAMIELRKMKIITDKVVTQAFSDAKKAKIKAAKALAASNRRVYTNEEINLNKLRISERGYNDVTSDMITYKLGQLDTKVKGLKVYDNKDSEKLRSLYLILKGSSKSNITLYEVAPTKAKYLDDIVSCVKLKDFLSVDYKLVRQIGTAMYIEKTAPFVLELGKITNLSAISPKLADIVKTLKDYHREYLDSYKNGTTSVRTLIGEIYELCKDKNFFDEEVRGLLEENRVMLQRAEFLKLLVSDRLNYSSSIPVERINLAVDYILARRLFRPSLEAVKKLHEERIIKINN